MLNISYQNNNYKLICPKKDNIKYRARKCAYVILNDEKDNIGIAKEEKYFFLGGGKEKDESDIQTIKREMLEEIGYDIININFFDRIISYEYSNSRGYLKIIASIYTAKLGNKIQDPIEKNYSIVWNKPKDFINLVYYEYQKFILKELHNLGGFNVK